MKITLVDKEKKMDIKKLRKGSIVKPNGNGSGHRVLTDSSELANFTQLTVKTVKIDNWLTTLTFDEAKGSHNSVNFDIKSY